MNEIPFIMNAVVEAWRVYFVQRKATIVGRRGQQALIFWFFCIKAKEHNKLYLS
jgi:hypothetical protein